MKPLVIIPTYNEAGSILKVIEGLLDNPYHRIHILVVDDGSPDGTADIVANIQSLRVHLLRREAKNGLGSAYRAGFDWALKFPEYTHIVTMDGDGSHHSSDINRLFARASLADVVLGSRWVWGGEVYNWPLSRRVLSRMGSAYSRLALGLPFRDITGGYRVYTQEILKKIDTSHLSSEGYCFQIEMLLKAYRKHVKITEVPIMFSERTEGYSKMDKAIIKESIRKVSNWGWHYRLGLMKD